MSPPDFLASRFWTATYRSGNLVRTTGATSDHYCVKRELRDTVLFALHNLTNDPPFSRLDLISCRNVLIYFERDLQRQACGIFNYALYPGGYLFLGASENADSPRDAFALIDRDARIYQSAGK